MKKLKKINNIGIISGLFLIYIGINMVLGITSNNLANKSNTYIDSALATINIYQNSNNENKYNEDKAELFNNKWTSGERINSTYKKISVIYGNNPTPLPSRLSTSVTYITRNSH